MTRRDTCPSCRARGLVPFYEVRGVPVESSIVLGSREDALAIPTGDVVLAWCPSCGFITNAAHPGEIPVPRSAYEDQQGFSATFSSFAGRMAEEVVERYDLRGGTVLEIGCGKGDFLALVCQRGDSRGVGVDPLFRADRLDPASRERITAVTEHFRPEHADFGPDVVVCRHTLEHIPDTRGFLEMVRRGAGEGTPVIFEVPDAGRILTQAAFWDVYYEHCSYFTEQSLGHAFAAAGFAVEEIRLEYGGQYLVLFARAGAAPSTYPGTGGDSLQAAVRSFDRRVGDAAAAWRERADDGIVIWGSGSKCVGFVTTLGISGSVSGVVDINPHRRGRFVPGLGQPVMAPEDLRNGPPRTIVAMNPIYRGEIESTVRALGIDSAVLAV